MFWRRAFDGKEASLRGNDRLRRLGPVAVRRLAQAGELVDAPEGAVLHEAGRRGAAWWLVLDGVVVLDGEDGPALAAAGDGWGVDAALAGRPTSQRAVAASAVRCLVVPRANLSTLLTDAPALAVDLLRRPRLGTAA